MVRVAIVGILALVALAGASQLLLPPFLEGRIEDRLTEGGGSADVSLEAEPAARLLFNDGERIEVRGEGLDLDLDDDPDAFSRLDGFDAVDVNLNQFRAGPFEVERFNLSRDGSVPYRLESRSATSAASLVDYGADEFDLPGGPLLGFLAGQAPKADRRIPIQLAMDLESDDGRIQVVSGGGKIAGYDTGPLAELLTSAIVVRL